MFGIGCATAEDRLFFVDALRHAGRGELAAFAGGANVPMDESVRVNAPYTDGDLHNQISYPATAPPDGQQILSDPTNYVDGINAYIARAEVDPLLMPGGYLALGHLGGPAPFTLEDLVSIASLVGGIFRRGGGDQLANAVLEGTSRGASGPSGARSGVAGGSERDRRRRAARPCESAQQVYPADGVCPAGDQMCSDSIQFRAIGAITQPGIEWINRPTFQQAVEIQGHAP